MGLRYTGYGIVVEDGSDFGAICYTHNPATNRRFATDEEAVAWAAATFPPGTWKFVALTDGEHI